MSPRRRKPEAGIGASAGLPAWQSLERALAATGTGLVIFAVRVVDGEDCLCLHPAGLHRLAKERWLSG